MVTITIANKKGGSGKTSTALALVDAAVSAGKKVLAVDMDPQGNLSATLGADRELVGSAELLLKKEARLEDYVQDLGGGLALVAGSGELVDVELQLIKTVGKEMKLAEALAQAEGYDFCIIDTPPSTGLLTVAALCATDKVVIAASADAYAADGYAELAGDIASIKKYYNPGLKVDGILLTRYNERTTLARQMIKEYRDLAEATGTRLYNARIRECIAVREAQYSHKLLSEYDAGCNAVQDYRVMAKELGVL